jgi:hypothetical protein
MSYYIKKKKIINIFSDGSILLTKTSFINKINFLEKDFKNSKIWIKPNKMNTSKNFIINKLEYRKKFFNKKINFPNKF